MHQRSIICDRFLHNFISVVMQIRTIFIIVLAMLTLQSCVYRMDIDQGNRIAADKLEQLQTGMTRDQVEFLLGQAAIKDLYHANQSHYIYYLYDGETQLTEQKTMTLTFEQDILVTIEGSL